MLHTDSFLTSGTPAPPTSNPSPSPDLLAPPLTSERPGWPLEQLERAPLMSFLLHLPGPPDPWSCAHPLLVSSRLISSLLSLFGGGQWNLYNI